jgi:hypothetical protein
MIMVQLRYYPSIWLEQVWNTTKTSVKIAHIWTKHLLITSLDIAMCRGAWLLTGHGLAELDLLTTYTHTHHSKLLVITALLLISTHTHTLAFSVYYKPHYPYPNNPSIVTKVCLPHHCIETAVLLPSSKFISAATCLLSWCLAVNIYSGSTISGFRRHVTVLFVC